MVDQRGSGVYANQRIARVSNALVPAASRLGERRVQRERRQWSIEDKQLHRRRLGAEREPTEHW